MEQTTDICKYYLQEKEMHGLKQSTLSTYIYTLEAHILPHLPPYEYSDAIVHSFRKFRAPLSGKAEHAFPV